MYKSIKLIVAFATLAIFAVNSGCKEQKHTPAPSLTELTLKLHWIPDAHQLGFWVALDKGFYREHGLDMRIYSGGMDANPIRDILNGSADVGQVGGIEQVILAANENLPVKAIAAVHRRSPHALISLQSRPIKGPADAPGKTIAVAFGDTAEILLKAYLDKAGVNLDSVNLVPYRYDLSPLLLGQVDAVTGFSTGQPVTIREKGQDPCVLSYDSIGVNSYGYTLVASDKAIASKKVALKAFLAASREGWSYAFANPDEAAEIFAKRFGNAADVNRTKAELALIREIMLNEENLLAQWRIDENVLKKVKTMLVKYAGVREDLRTDSLYTNALLDEQ